MSERFVFHPNPSLGEIEQAGETTQGLEALGQIQSEFSSVADALNHVQNFGADSSVVHLPDGGAITLVHLSKAEIVHYVAPHVAKINSDFF